jgi:hypothetical protein
LHRAKTQRRKENQNQIWGELSFAKPSKDFIPRELSVWTDEAGAKLCPFLRLREDKILV